MNTIRFDELDLNPQILRGIADMGFEEATPIQSQAIPVVLSGVDVIGQAQTGTGKTAAFGIPILQKVDPSLRKTQVLILSPTRELAIQVADEIRKLAKYMHGVKVLPVYGGQDISRQIKALKGGVQIIIGTPGRLMDHLRRKTIRPDFVHTIVLDEADEMLNMNFLDEVQAILKYMPKKHVTCLFSATYPAVIQRMSKKYLYKPAKIDLTSTNKPNILEEAYHVNEEHKELFLLHLLALKKPESCMIFCKTQARVDEVYECLEKNQVSVDKIHGGMMQEERLSHMRRFKKGKVRILVCTDVASRGIDVFKVEMIINYDMPSPVETYTHRIGRSGRVDEQGLAISLVNEYDGVRKEKLEEYLGYNLPFKEEGEVYLSDLDVLDSLKESNRMVVDKSKDLRKGITKIYLNGGKNKKIRPGDIVGAICEIDGVTVDDIGVIQVQDHQSYVDILNDKGKLVLKNLKTIKGKTLRIQKAKNGFGH